MATSVAIKRLETVTECAICVGDLIDARVLPCEHTFCLKCIEKWSLRRNSGEKVSCPICRQEFEIPEGTTALPRNCFVEKLVEVKKLSTTLSQGDVVCEVCCDDEANSGEKVTRKATVYCLDCRRNMCEQCRGHHQKFRLPGVHRLMELNSELNVDELLLKFPENVCDKHADKCTEIYCFDCKDAVCMMCYIKSHNSHRCSDIKEVADDLGKQMTSSAEKLASKVTECQTVLRNIDENEKVFCDKVAETEQLICDRSEKLTHLVEAHKQSLLEHLWVSKDKQLKHTANVREEIERHQVVVENFIRYSNEVKEKGTACDIAKLAGKLNARLDELLNFDMGTDLTTSYDVTEVSFTSAQTDDDMKQLFGNLTINVHGYFRVSCQAVQTMPNLNGSVTGIAVLNNRMYVSLRGNQQIAVYCPDTFQFQQGLICYCPSCGSQSGYISQCCYPQHRGHTLELQHIVACDSNNCLFVSIQDTYNGNRICKVVTDQNNTLSSWSVAYIPQGLSVIGSHNILVAMSNAYFLMEYSPDGQMIRQINLQPAGITKPMHAVQLSDDQFGVTHHGPKHQFSIVRSDGELVQSYGGDAGDMNQPQGIAVDQRGRIFVADQDNNRILVMHSKTLSAYALPLPTDCQLQGPHSNHFEAASSRLYIGEWNGRRIVCCQM